MKILFNTGRIYLHGGIEKSIAERANFLIDQPGYEVFILTVEQKKKPSVYHLDSRIQLIDLDVNYDREKSYFNLKNLKKALKHYRRQREMFKKINPDVILSPNYNFDHYWLPFIKNNALLIKERHNSYYNRQNPKGVIQEIKQKIEDYIDNKYDWIVALNKKEKEYIKGNNAVVIPNLIQKSPIQVELDSKKVMAAGRIAPVKKFEELIRIWKQVANDFSDWKLHIYGQDYLGTVQQLKNLIEQLDLKNQVFIKDAVPDLRNQMLDYSIFAMTSKTECFPTVLLEALSVGLPIVSYDCPHGPRHIVENGINGFLIENKNQEQFKEKLKKLMAEKELRIELGKRAKLSSEKFEPEKVMKKWMDLFERQKHTNNEIT